MIYYATPLAPVVKYISDMTVFYRINIEFFNINSAH